MSGAKEIRGKIASIKNTQKITRAMQMVAASKMRKAQDRMAASRPYAQRIRRVIGHLTQAGQDFRHPYLTEREVKNVGFIVVSTDRGLCGSLNVNLFKSVIAELRKYQDQDIGISMCLVGAKGVSFFRRLKVNTLGQVTHLGDTPHVTDLIGTVKVMLDAFSNGELDEVYLAHNVFVNTMSQKPDIKRLLPVEPVGQDELQTHWDYIYEPSPEDLIEGVLMRYIESQVYRGAMENVACEMAARMVAMKSATDNAGNLIDELQLIYNKARQAAITQEISEIVGGAAAV